VALTLTWLGQAGFALAAEGTTLLVDPFLSDHPDRLVPAPDAGSAAGALVAAPDAVLATHEHLDHLDLPAWTRIAGTSPHTVFVVPAPVVDQVSGAGIAGERVLAAEPGTPVRLGAATVTPVPARHGVHVADAYTFGDELPSSGGRVRYLGYVVELGGVSTYHAGDTIGYDGQAERLRELGVQVALLPVNGRDAEREAADLVGNLSAEEAADLAGAAGVELVVPMHYEMVRGNTADPSPLVAAVRSRWPAVSVAVPGTYGTVTVMPTRAC